MKAALLFLCIIGITCAFSAKHFRRRFKSDDSEENAVFKNRNRHFLYRYPYFYPPMKRFQFNSDSSEEGFGGNSSEEEEEEEGGQSNEENEGGKGSEETTVAPTTAATGDTTTDANVEPPTEVPVVEDPLQKPRKEAGDKKVDNAPKKGAKEEDSDENEEEENEEEEEEKVDENGSGANATSTNSTLEETGNGGEEEEEEENEATTIRLTTLVTTVNPTESTTGEQAQDQTSPADTTTENPWVNDGTTTNVYEHGYEDQTDYYASENGYPRGDTFRTYEDEYSYYKGHGYDVYGQDYYYNQ
ncbi:integrin-binding sialoprotein-like [Erythrolamprus reginae]|uniref:integrin-binding sialoprotein-like n=1 Tax=Erythrolamprus reginae TaxID=121349 RepID=UPI00396C2D0F